jgi:hypothetical protein
MADEISLGPSNTVSQEGNKENTEQWTDWLLDDWDGPFA